MRKRALRIEVIKTKKNEPIESIEADITLEGKAEIISRYFQKGAARIGTAVIGYVVADTLRQVIIAQAKK